MIKGLSQGFPYSDSRDVRICGPEHLKELGDPNADHFTDCISAEVGFNQNFFYQINQFKAGSVSKAERGVGYLYKKEATPTNPSCICLTRYKPLHYWDGYQFTPIVPGRQVDFNLRDTHITITTYKPDKYHEALQGDYVVMCSSASQTPTPVELSNKTLLGRLDGRIQSIDSDELLEIVGREKLIGEISQHEGAIELRTRVLNLVNNGLLSLSSIKLRAYIDSNRPEPTEGTIIYNGESKSLQLGVGDKWIKINTEE
jgi:hypothetical protein